MNQTKRPNTAGEADEEQHGDRSFPVIFKWIAGVFASVITLLLPVNTFQVSRLEDKASAATDASTAVKQELVGLRGDVSRLDVTLRAFIAEKNAEANLRISLLEQRVTALEKE